MITGSTDPVGRLAPTPSGELHLGNVCAFLGAWLSARAQGGRLLLRIEDVDRPRARPEIEDSQRRDLRWLGLGWDEEVTRQSRRDYEPWLGRLAGRTYVCTCSRKQLREGGPACPCRQGDARDGSLRFRLDPGPMDVVDRRFGLRRADPASFGDPILRRRDGVYTYNLAVVVDDLTDGVTEVVRGADLLDYVTVQEQLWEALGATPPTWLHTPLVLGPDGRKLGKSHGSLHIGALREAGWTPRDVLAPALAWLGLPDLPLAQVTERFDPLAGPRGPLTLHLPDSGCPSPAEGLSWTQLDPPEAP